MEKPEIGKEYHFWDDGKVSPSRHYICKVTDIITLEQAKDIILEFTQFEGTIDEEDNIFPKMSLYDIWMHQKEMTDWIFADKTPYFVKISIPTYDDNDLYCAYTKHDGWFSLDIQSSWQGGILDIDNKKWDYIMKEYANSIEDEETKERIKNAYLSATYLKK